MIQTCIKYPLPGIVYVFVYSDSREQYVLLSGGFILCMWRDFGDAQACIYLILHCSPIQQVAKSHLLAYFNNCSNAKKVTAKKV